MKILVAVDGSPHSDAAVAEVGNRPWPENSEVRLLTVDSPLELNWRRSGLMTVYDEVVQQQRAEAVRRLDAATSALRQSAPGLSVHPVLREGKPKDVILEEAKDWGADLIVLGSQGHGAVRRLFLGSVSLAVATNSRCSVQIVRSPSCSSEATTEA